MKLEVITGGRTRGKHQYGYIFLVGVFEENPDSYNGYFFHQFNAIGPLFCIMHFYHLYLILHFQRIQSLT